jgi:acyl-[acyl-carrier-protein] desaturase
MTASPAFCKKMYRTYLEFFESAERKRRWHIFDDIPWESLDSSKNDERKAVCVETFCAEEFYLPDYSSNGIDLTRSMFGLVFREYLTRAGMRSEAEFANFEQGVFSRVWTLPFQTRRQMACYGALQETATYLAYKAQKDKAQREGDRVLEAIFSYVSRDEAAHAGFYRAMIQLELSEDREGTITDLAHVISQFKMPGEGLIPNYQERLRTSGAGISTRLFVEHGLLPTLRTLGTGRDELKGALQRRDATPRVAPVAEKEGH